MTLTNEEVIALRDFIAFQYVSGQNLVLINTVRKIMNAASTIEFLARKESFKIEEVDGY